jgi:hypothetical protein
LKTELINGYFLESASSLAGMVCAIERDDKKNRKKTMGSALI